jgi:hypothetical protein
MNINLSHQFRLCSFSSVQDLFEKPTPSRFRVRWIIGERFFKHGANWIQSFPVHRVVQCLNQLPLNRVSVGWYGLLIVLCPRLSTLWSSVKMRCPKHTICPWWNINYKFHELLKFYLNFLKQVLVCCHHTEWDICIEN